MEELENCATIGGLGGWGQRRPLEGVFPVREEERNAIRVEGLVEDAPRPLGHILGAEAARIPGEGLDIAEVVRVVPE